MPWKINLPFPLIVIISPLDSFLDGFNSSTEFIKTLPNSIYSSALVLEHFASSDIKQSNY